MNEAISNAQGIEAESLGGNGSMGQCQTNSISVIMP